MLGKVKFQLLLATAVSFTLINSMNIQLFSSGQETRLNISHEAEARSSGGRSGGGSFSRGSSSRSSPSRSSGSSSPRNSSAPSSSRRSNRSYQRDTSPTKANSTYNRGNTGGRAGGGSFERNTRPAPSAERQQNPPRREPIYPRNDSYQNQPYYRQPGGNTVIVPVPAAPQTYPYSADPGTSNSSQTLPRNSSGYSSNSTEFSDDDEIVFLIVALMIGGAVLWGVFMLIKHKSAGGSAAQELDNDIVTISKIQVALLAEARSVQSQLSELSLITDTDTSEGLLQLLQESALALLRTPENWTHVLSSSQAVRSREAAETVFNKLSFEERSKFSAETLTNVDGSIRQKEVSPSLDEDPAAYIVVTLLVGTADDQPLFAEIRTAEALREALHKVASIPLAYLMVFELLWSPQAETDTLTYDELLTEYTDMVQI